jgi:hypothetical protein
MFENTFTILAFLVLVPLLPAILLFKFLPSTAVVSGPLAGFTVNLGGAFGGYFALVTALSVFYVHDVKKPVDVWTVKGHVAGPAHHEIDCELSPPVLRVTPGNQFRWQIPVVKGDALPEIIVQANGYEGETLELSEESAAANQQDYGVKVDPKTRTVTFHKTIVLHKATPPQPAPQQPITAGGV